jgi:Uma2 family endonuclease
VLIILFSLYIYTGVDDLHQLSSYLHDISYESSLCLGLALGLSYPKLRRLEKATFLLDMLSMWLREEDDVIKFGPPTWKTLVNALRDKTVGQNGIAQTIEDDHC